MLYLTRKVGEAVVINHDIEVRVVELRGKTVKLGFVFPNNASVLREEVFQQLREANLEAAAGARELQAEVDGAAGEAGAGDPVREDER
ncbi:MAG: carbon storage regulator [Geminicoccaceae bacterium]|nr:MAG: carbon storage regulator [Geminicoccaceae bacterium]